MVAGDSVETQAFGLCRWAKVLVMGVATGKMFCLSDVLLFHFRR